MSLLEAQRHALEDLEWLELAVSNRLANNPRTYKDRLEREHEIAHLLERVKEQSKFLVDTFDDIDGNRKREMEAMAQSDPFEQFYAQLKETKYFHRNYPNQVTQNLEEEYRKKQPLSGGVTDIDLLFSGEEGYGRFLDLVRHHELFLNLKGVSRISYLQYLSEFDNFASIKNETKDSNYSKYLQELSSYLESFLRRSNPLSNPQNEIHRIRDEFKQSYNASDDSLYCAFCERHFSKQTVFDAHLSGKKHLKAVETQKGANLIRHDDSVNGTRASKEDRRETIARLEFTVGKLAELVKGQRNETKSNVERKQSMTDRERQLELAALDKPLEPETSNGANGDEDPEDDDIKISNPLKLPMGWDGRPIPFWLWKLHGLGVEFHCEICGNFVYMGRRAFDKHFLESRHTHGLRCLGIQNSPLFKEITGIKDAVHLWESMKQKKRKEESLKENAVEMEDDEGNVMSARIYEDLKKQGLL